LAIFFLLGTYSLLRAGTIEVSPGQVMQYTFTTDPETFGCPPALTASSCDTLVLSIPFVSPVPDTLTAQLFDGPSLLGSSSGNCCLVAFTSASSIYDLGTVVDFTSIQNGTIDGIIDVSSTQPFELDSDGVTTLSLAHANGFGSTAEDTLSATLTNSGIVPEPAQMPAFLAIVLFGAIGLRRLTARRTEKPIA
jgi:hypothetical protein